MEGWIKLHRSMLENWLWEDKPFSRGQAWIDLLLMANHKEKDTILGKEHVVIERGSFITSELKLMERWGWSKSKVRAFLQVLENDKMLIKKTDRKKTTITIVNYSTFQDLGTTEEPQKDHKKTVKRPQKDTTKNEKNERIYIFSNEKIGNTDAQEDVFTTIRELYNSVCGSYPRLVKMSDTRKKAVNARLKSGYTLDDFKALFEKAEASSFLKGGNNRNWSATFDWLITDGNMAKVLDGNYDDKKQEVNNAAGYGVKLW